jgi:anti-sigma factor RsiW
MNGHPITEDDLNAYVDELLSPTRRAEVAAYLAQYPDVATRVTRHATLRGDLRAAFAHVAEEPVPPELNLARLIDERPRRQRGSGWAIAASVLLLGIGGLGGWALRGLAQPPTEGVAALAREAADSYAVYALDRTRPVELRADAREELVDWASARLQRPVAVPDLSALGYRFMGGRVVATSHGPAVLFMYDNDHGTRLVMLTRPMAIDEDAPMLEHSRGPVTGFAWSNQGVGYSLFGEAPANRLHPLADEVRRQLAHRA